MNRDELEGVASEVVHACLIVHRALGPGLLESVYEACLEHELRKLGLRVTRQHALPVRYDGLVLDTAFRVDLFVEQHLILEIKAVREVHPVHLAQLRTYLRCADCRLGLLLNFGGVLMKTGIHRVVNNL